MTNCLWNPFYVLCFYRFYKIPVRYRREEKGFEWQQKPAISLNDDIDEFPAELCKKGQQEAEKKYFGYSFRLRRKRNG